jgi:hypothetical protein
MAIAATNLQFPTNALFEPMDITAGIQRSMQNAQNYGQNQEKFNWDREDRDTRKGAGAKMAAGDYEGGVAHALKGGMIDKGFEWGKASEDRSRELFGKTYGALALADTPEKYAATLGVLKRTGIDVPQEYQDFNARNMIMSRIGHPGKIAEHTYTAEIDRQNAFAIQKQKMELDKQLGLEQKRAEFEQKIQTGVMTGAITREDAAAMLQQLGPAGLKNPSSPAAQQRIAAQGGAPQQGVPQGQPGGQGAPMPQGQAQGAPAVQPPPISAPNGLPTEDRPIPLQGRGQMPPGSVEGGIGPRVGNDVRLPPLSADAQMAQRGLKWAAVTGDRGSVQSYNDLLKADPTQEARAAAATLMGKQGAEEQLRAAKIKDQMLPIFDEFKSAAMKYGPEVLEKAIGPYMGNQNVQARWSQLPFTDQKAYALNKELHHYVGLVASQVKATEGGKGGGTDADMEILKETLGAALEAKDTNTFFSIIHAAENRFRRSSMLPGNPEPQGDPSTAHIPKRGDPQHGQPQQAPQGMPAGNYVYDPATHSLRPAR